MKRILLLIIISTLIYGTYVFQKNLSTQKTTSNATELTTQNSEMDTDMLREIIGVIKVEANQNTLTPNTIEIPHTKSMMLDIHAVDQDYAFNVNDFNIHETIQKGETKQIKVSGLGVGDYVFSCGFGCMGTITVKNLSDTDDDVR